MPFTELPSDTIGHASSFLDSKDTHHLLIALTSKQNESHRKAINNARFPQDQYRQKEFLLALLKNPKKIPAIEDTLENYCQDSKISYENRLLAAAVLVHRYLALKDREKLLAANQKLESLGKYHPKLFYVLAANTAKHDAHNMRYQFYCDKIQRVFDQTLKSAVSHQAEWETASQLLEPAIRETFIATLDAADAAKQPFRAFIVSLFKKAQLLAQAQPFTQADLKSHMDFLMVGLEHNDSTIRLSVCHGIQVFAPLLNETLAEECMVALIKATPIVDRDGNKKASTRKAIPQALAALMLRLSPDKCAKYLDDAMHLFVGNLENNDDPAWRSRVNAGEFLQAFMSQPHIELDTLKKYLPKLIQGLQIPDSRVRIKVCKFIAAIAKQLDASSARLCFDAVITHVRNATQMADETQVFQLEAEGQALTALVGKLSAPDINYYLLQYAELLKLIETKPNGKASAKMWQVSYSLAPVAALLYVRKYALEKIKNTALIEKICSNWLAILYQQFTINRHAVDRIGSMFAHTCKTIGELASQANLNVEIAKQYANILYDMLGKNNAARFKPFRHTAFIALSHLAEKIAAENLQAYFKPLAPGLPITNSIPNFFNRLLLPEEGPGSSLQNRDELRQARWRIELRRRPAPVVANANPQPTVVNSRPANVTPVVHANTNNGVLSFFWNLLPTSLIPADDSKPQGGAPSPPQQTMR